MNNKFLTFFSNFVILILMHSHVLANSAISYVNNQAIFNFYTNALYYREPNAFNRVYGLLPGLKLQINKMFDPFYTEIAVSYARANILYDGGISYKSPIGERKFIPFKAKSQNSLLTTEAKLGFYLPINVGCYWIPYLQLGFREWQRAVPPTIRNGPDFSINGFDEIYDHYFLAVGTQISMEIYPNFIVTPSFSIGRIIRPYMKLTLPTQLPCDTPECQPTCIGANMTLQLGSKLYGQLGLGISYFFTDTMNIDASINFTRFYYGKSPVNTSSVFEPDSYTNELKFSTGIGFSFA